MKIYEYVDKVIKDNNIITAPVDLVKICNAEGIEIVKKNMDDRTSGFIVIKKEDEKIRKVICINENHSTFRQFFTIAHELGHYFMHYDKTNDFYAHRDDGKILNRKIEREANIFASLLLIPKDLLTAELDSYLADHGEPTFDLVYHISRIFAVSIPASRIRLEDRGIKL